MEEYEMNIDNIRIKNHLSFEDHKAYVRFVANAYFDTDEKTGEKYYAPENARIALFLGFVRFCVEGIEFAENESYETCLNDDFLYSEFLTNEHKAAVYAAATDASDIAEFEKQRLLTAAAPVNTAVATLLGEYEKLLKTQTRLHELQIQKEEYTVRTMNLLSPEENARLNKKILEMEIDPEKLAEMMVEKLAGDEKKISKIINSKH